MNHPDEGALRRALDGGAARERISDHLEGCATCRAVMDGMRRDADFARSALAVDGLGLEKAPAFAGVRSVRRRFWQSAPGLAGTAVAVAAVIAAVFAFTPVGSMAAGLLTIFQPQSVVGVVLPPGEGRAIVSTMNELGTVEGNLKIVGEPAASAAAAAQAAGFSAEVPSSLPSDVTGGPTYLVVPARNITFTFSQAKAAAWAAKNGKTLPAMPPGMDGATLTLQTEPVTVEAWQSASANSQPFLIAQSPAPVVTSTGPSVAEIEQYVANLPGIPAGVRAQILSLGSPATTLPVPVPSGTTATPVSVNGTSGLLLGADGGGLKAIVWQAGDTLHVVGGAESEATLLQVAESLH